MAKVKQRKKSLRQDFIKYFFICSVFIFLGAWLIGNVANGLLPENLDGYKIFVGGENQLYFEENAYKENAATPEKYLFTATGLDLVQFLQFHYGHWHVL